jgi:dienelactone hydrolase
MLKLSRRRLFGLAAGASAAGMVRLEARQAQTAATSYIGPLTGVTGLADRGFDPVVFARDTYAAAPRQLRFAARSRADAERWQQELKAKLTDLLGGFPRERAPLRPVTLETRSFPAYTREKLVFDSRPGVSVLAYLLMPQGAPRPAPVVICIPGHGRGVDDIVGIDERGNDRTDKAGYQHDFAIQAAEAGLAALAIEPMGFGCRRDPINARKGLGQKACEPVAGGALMTGQTLIGWRVWDVMRTVDLIEARTDLDASRVGCMGISGGGTATLFSTALEPRIRAALVSGYLKTFRDSVGSLAHCVDNYIPGILNWAEMHDIAGLIAPRPLFVESGEQDAIFPVASSIASFAEVQKIYEVFGSADRTRQEVFPGEHSFWGKQAIPFLVKSLTEWM